jgi:hypothetical protein
MAATLVLGLVASPHLYLYDLMLLLVPFALLLARRLDQRVLLGGGPLLAWTVAVWALCSLGTQLSLLQTLASARLGLGERALQLSVVALLGWGLALLRGAEVPTHPRLHP